MPEKTAATVVTVSYYRCRAAAQQVLCSNMDCASCACQVWKRAGWPAGAEDGFFVQLDSLHVKHTWFLPLKRGVVGCVSALKPQTPETPKP